MYISFLLTPKQYVSFLHDTDNVEYALKKLKESGYKEIPVLTKKGNYCGTITEGDFLWNLMEEKRKHKRLDLVVTLQIERLDEEGVTTLKFVHIDVLTNHKI